MVSTSFVDNCRSRWRRMPVVSVSLSVLRVRLPAFLSTCVAHLDVVLLSCSAANFSIMLLVLLPNMLDLTFATTLGRNSCLTDSGT